MPFSTLVYPSFRPHGVESVVTIQSIQLLTVAKCLS